MKTHTIFLLSLLAVAGLKAQVTITVSATPALPVKNLLTGKNASFENGLKQWQCNVQKHKANGISVGLSTIAAEGQKALHLDTSKAKKGLNLGWTSGGVSVIKVINEPQDLFKDGHDYIISCSAQINGPGSGYTGVGLTHYLKQNGWKSPPWNQRMETQAIIRGPTGEKWQRFVSKPFTFHDIGKLVCSIAIRVIYERSDVKIDDIGIYPATTELTVNVKGTDILQVAIENAQGELVYVSDRFDKQDIDFSKTVKVSSICRYKIKTIDRNGKVIIKNYPDN